MLNHVENLSQWKWKPLSRVQLIATPWTVHGILQARILEWAAFPFSKGSSPPRDRTQISHIAGGFFYQLSHQEWYCIGGVFFYPYFMDGRSKFWRGLYPSVTERELDPKSIAFLLPLNMKFKSQEDYRGHNSLSEHVTGLRDKGITWIWANSGK